GEVPAEHVHAVGLRGALAGADGPLELGGDVGHVAGGDGCLDAADVDQAAALGAAQPGVAVQRRGAVQPGDELRGGGVAPRGLFGRLGAVPGELAGLPELAFVLAQVLDDEGADPGDLQEALAGGVDGEAAQVAGDPAAAELLGDGCCSPGAGETVEDEV